MLIKSIESALSPINSLNSGAIPFPFLCPGI